MQQPQLFSPSNSGQTFLQQVMPPSLVNWPRAVSRKNTGIPQHTKKMTYGTKNAPLRTQVKKNHTKGEHHTSAPRPEKKPSDFFVLPAGRSDKIVISAHSVMPQSHCKMTFSCCAVWTRYSWSISEALSPRLLKHLISSVLSYSPPVAPQKSYFLLFIPTLTVHSCAFTGDPSSPPPFL